MNRYPLFNLKRIKISLDEVKVNFDMLNEQVEGKRERMTDELVEHIIEAYAYLNQLLEKKIELFSPAGYYSMLELNHIVLCGTRQDKRFEYHQHIVETRKKFQANIQRILEWYYKKGKDHGSIKRAAKFYLKALSQPQLFIEGNHRTENVIFNYILVTSGEAPFILAMDNALEYFELSTRIKFSDMSSIYTSLTKAPGLEKDFKHILEKYGSKEYLCC